MLYLTKTPLRVSLFGGGTDYPEYFEREKGAVIGMAIDKYIHIAGLKLSNITNYNYRLSYSKLEMCDKVEDIQHPVVREVLRHMSVEDKLDFSIMSDLPSSGSGLGSSSSFTVGFINLINIIQNNTPTRFDLAKAAIEIERDILQENVGVQDQLHAAFGGLNRFDFHKGKYSITPISLSGNTLNVLNESMFLVHTGVSRRATDIAHEQVSLTKTKSIDSDLGDLYQMVEECMTILERNGPNMLEHIGKMLSQAWNIKRSLSSSITSGPINELYEHIMNSGAVGAKLCGAGGGGYFLCLVPKHSQTSFLEKLSKTTIITTHIDVKGTTQIYPTVS